MSLLKVEILDGSNAPKGFFERGLQIAEERQLDKVVREAQQEHRTNTDKLFTLIKTSGIDPRVHDDIFQAIFAPTPEYFPTSWPASLPDLEESEYGEFYSNPEAAIKKDYKSNFERLLKWNSGSISDLVLEYIPIIDEQTGDTQIPHRWTKEGYQKIIFQLLESDYDPESVQALFQYFNIKGLNPSRDGAYKPLEDLFDVLITSSKSEDWLRKAAATQMHEIIIQEEKNGILPDNPDERALPIYKHIVTDLLAGIITWPSGVREDYYNATHKGHSLGLRNFILDELEWLMDMIPEGPIYDLPIFKQILEKLEWQVYKDYYFDEKCRTIIKKLLKRQIFPTEDYPGVTITNDDDVNFVNWKLLGRSQNRHGNIYDDLPPKVRTYLEEELMNYRTQKALGDKPYPEGTVEAQRSVTSASQSPHIEFPRNELNNIGEPTKRI